MEENARTRCVYWMQLARAKDCGGGTAVGICAPQQPRGTQEPPADTSWVQPGVLHTNYIRHRDRWMYTWNEN